MSTKFILAMLVCTGMAATSLMPEAQACRLKNRKAKHPSSVLLSAVSEGTKAKKKTPKLRPGAFGQELTSTAGKKGGEKPRLA